MPGRRPNGFQLKKILREIERAAGTPAHPFRKAAQRARQLYSQQARRALGDLTANVPGSRLLHEARAAIGGDASENVSELGRAIAEELGAGSLLTGYDLLRDVQRYARGGSATAALTSLLRNLGPVGRAISLVLDRTQGTQDITQQNIQQAISLLRGLGYQVTPPQRPVPISGTGGSGGKGGSGGLPGTGTAMPGRGGVNQPWHWAISPPGNTGTQRAGTGSPGLPEGQFVGNEYIAMYRVVGSSNVAAIGYNPNTQTMRVQYLAPVLNANSIKGRGHKGKNRVRGRLGSTVSKHRHGGGPTYDYHGVPVSVFKKIYAASSKGGAIWDYLRIRGTVYGHQYDYELVGAGLSIVAQPPALGAGPWKRVGVVTYVPRKAVGPGAFKSRSIQQGRNTFKSLLPTVGLRKGKLSP